MSTEEPDDYDGELPREEPADGNTAAHVRNILATAGHGTCEFGPLATYNPQVGVVVCGCGLLVEPPTQEVNGVNLVAGNVPYDPADPIGSTLALIDPTRPYTPADVEYHILDVLARLERGALFERACIEAASQAQAAWDRLYFATVHTSDQTSELKRKAEAEVACQEAGLTDSRNQTKMMAAAIKATMHNLRAVLTGYQSTARSVGAAYQTGLMA